ncbi:MAG: hypothetical protein IPM34_05280 [Saprospiraceae bacterium]|nr:hypothetical protein [Saprospiraceae bacterium]
MSQRSAIIICLGGAILGLCIPVWYLPFLFGFFAGVVFKFSPRYFYLIHFLVYMAVCLIYTYLVSVFGSKDLIDRIGELFMGFASGALMMLSSFFYGVHALAGVLCGRALRVLLQSEKSDE